MPTEKLTYFANITSRALVVHTHPPASSRCIGYNKIPATEDDMERDGKVEILQGKPYRIYVCRLCLRRYRMIREAQNG